jgi:hypothetical protein
MPVQKPKRQRRKRVTIGFLFAFIEAAALLLWQYAEAFHGHKFVLTRWLSSCLLVFGPFLYLHQSSKNKKYVWIIYVIICLFFAYLNLQILPIPYANKGPHFIPYLLVA